MLGKLEKFERTASDPNRYFVKGKHYGWISVAKRLSCFMLYTKY